MLLKHANACVNVLTVSFEPLSFNWFESLVGLVKLTLFIFYFSFSGMVGIGTHVQKQH